MTISRRSLFFVGVAGFPVLAQAQKKNRKSDLSLTERRIRHELVTLPFYGVFDNLSFRLVDGKVTLTGQVVRPVMKTSAERVVKNVEGVREVDNQIEVLPLSPNDDRIRIDTYRTIYGHPALQLYQLRAVPPIHIIVRNGDITLEGVVARQQDKDIAGIQANTVPGAFKVTNNLRIDGEIAEPETP